MRRAESGVQADSPPFPYGTTDLGHWAGSGPQLVLSFSGFARPHIQARIEMEVLQPTGNVTGSLYGADPILCRVVEAGDPGA